MQPVVQKKQMGIKRLMAIILACAFLPVLLFSVANNVYASGFVQSQMIRSYRDSMRLFLKIVEDTYKRIELDMGALINANLSDLFASESASSSNETMLARQRLRRVFDRDALLSGNMDAVFLFNRGSGRMLLVNYGAMDDGEMVAVRQHLTMAFADGGSVDTGRWHSQQIDGRYYIMRILPISNTYLGTLIRADRQLSVLHDQHFVALDDAVFLDGEHRIISGSLLQKPVDSDLILEGDTHTDGGNTYYTVQLPLAKTDLILASLIRQDAVLGGLRQFRGVLIALIIALVLLTPLLYALINRFVVRPLANLTDALRAFRTGDMDIRVPQQTPVRELDIVGGTFNQMANEVAELKIQNYESTLEKQRTELQYYQLQIRPHFLINALNMISALAQAGCDDRILELSMFLAAYFRYLLREKGTFVSLREELQHVGNYLQIQQMRYPEKLLVQMHIDASLEDARVLPLMIQTFVENCIQYAVNMDRVTTLDIRADLVDPGRLALSIADSGPGFPREALASAGAYEHGGRMHCGIHNVRERLLLAYGERAVLQMHNLPGGGALGYMEVPRIPGGPAEEMRTC